LKHVETSKNQKNHGRENHRKNPWEKPMGKPVKMFPSTQVHQVLAHGEAVRVGVVRDQLVGQTGPGV